MLQRPRFKPHLHAEVIRGEGLFVLSERYQKVLQGRLYELIGTHIDGQPLEDLCEKLHGTATPAEVIYVIRQLAKKGFLEEADSTHPEGEGAFWATQNLDPAETARRLADTIVDVKALGGVDASHLSSLLESSRVRFGEPAALTVVLTENYLNPGLAAVNRAALDASRPWLIAKPVGSQLWLGPFFQPGTTACWECLAARLRSNFPVVGYITGRLGGMPPPIDRAQTPASLAIAAGQVANAVTNWIARGQSHLTGTIQTSDLITGRVETHSVVQQPTCPACGANPLRDYVPIPLQSRPKACTEDGGYRAATPEETVKRYGHHVSWVCGAVTMLEKTPVGDGVAHVYLSGHNIARGPQDLFALRTDLRSNSSGKGTTDAQARAGALAEGIERYSAVFRGDEPRRTARMRDLGDAAIHPNDCMRFSEQQYLGRDEWNKDRAGIYHYVPPAFDPEIEMEWSPVWSLTRQAVRYLPTAYCYFQYPMGPGVDACSADSNGNAAGNTTEEAILQGFFELVERDGVALWWYNRLRAPAIDLESFSDPYIPRLRTYLASHHRELWALDLTTDLGIPVVATVSRRTDGGAEQLMLGLGAHLDPRIALLRSLTELNQMLVHILDAPPEGPSLAVLNDKSTQDWLRTSTLENQPYLSPRPGAIRTAKDYEVFRNADLLDDVRLCQKRVENLGLEMLVLEQTRAEIGMPVVKVFVPGLRHFWARFAPGRLYDTPVRLGWLDQPLKEEDLNPIPMFL